MAITNAAIHGQGNYAAYAGPKTQGGIATADAAQGEGLHRIKPAVLDEIAIEVGKYEAPFVNLLAKMGVKTISGEGAGGFFRWFEQDIFRTTVEATSGSSGTTVELDTGEAKYVRLNDVLYHPGNDKHAMVTAISTDALTIEESEGLGTVADGDEIIVIGNTMPEGSEPATRGASNAGLASWLSRSPFITTRRSSVRTSESLVVARRWTLTA